MEATPWGASPSTRKLPTVEAARSRAADDPRTPYHSNVEHVRNANFTGTIWREERHEATIINLDTGESKTLTAPSGPALGAQIAWEQQGLLAARHQAEVTAHAPRTVWVAEIRYLDGSTERAEADTHDELLLTLLSWKARTTATEHAMAAQPPAPELLDDETREAWIFKDALRGQYHATPGNYRKLAAWLRERKLLLTAQNLLKAFHELNDAHELEEA
ncbi:MAG: hypothetical protein K6U89_19725 [Chloroflexi bacterium]|jgi:hypothetical protein|nr:hypothetical protein [Chloroflexota bacterium]